MLSRRGFIKQVAAAAGVMVVGRGCAGAEATGERGGILVNHAGFAPISGKHCLREGREAIEFQLIDTADGAEAWRGIMTPVQGDFGDYVVGDFSEFTRRGTYAIVAGGVRSETFEIGSEIYSSAIRKTVRYFARQRCGNSATGYHAPCHLDDGRRDDDGRHHNVTGGWHDACDVRKWVDATIYGMIGLSRVLQTPGPAIDEDADRIVEEMRWGNHYFLRMQEPDGFVMSQCGGDQGNYFTDNRRGTADDRIIVTEPVGTTGQFNFVASQAAMVMFTRETDKTYAGLCERAARKCLEWCIERRNPTSAGSVSSGAIACAAMHRAVGNDLYRRQAVRYARRLLELLVKESPDPGMPELRGYFLDAPNHPKPVREIMHGNLPLLALCELLESFPDDADAERWRDALAAHVEYLWMMSERSAFGTIPFGLYHDADPGGDRRIGRLWYRWFMKTHGEYKAATWWVGINAHLASNGVGLNRASRLLGQKKFARLAQRQLDWILGANPANASTVTDVGRNQPRLFVTGEFKPATPHIPGGVMNGLGGNAADALWVGHGSYHTAEYWTPMVAYTMWLMAELQSSASQA